MQYNVIWREMSLTYSTKQSIKKIMKICKVKPACLLYADTQCPGVLNATNQTSG